MRIHLQSLPNDPRFRLTPDLWEAAAARAPDVSAGHVVTFGDTVPSWREAAPEVEALVTQAAMVGQLVPLGAPRLRMVFCTSAGLEKLAPYDWLPPGVALLNNRGTHAAKAGEYGLMALLMLASHVPAFATAQRAGEWRPAYGSVLAGQHVVVVGLGALGGSVAGQAKRLGMRVTGVRNRVAPHEACDTVVGMDALDELLPQADMVVLAPPLTPATNGMLDRRRIALLRPGAGVVNMGRGALIDQDALCDALDTGHLGGAVLDVFTPEPVPTGHRLWTTSNLIMTPHVSADDPATYNHRSLDIFLDNLRALRNGQAMPNRFNLDRGY